MLVDFSIRTLHLFGKAETPVLVQTQLVSTSSVVSWINLGFLVGLIGINLTNV